LKFTAFKYYLKAAAIFIAAAFLLPLTSVAQSCTHMIFGSIKDGKDKSILPGASIRIKELNQAMSAEDDSHYHFNGLCAGKYTLQVSFIGYKDKEIGINLNKSATEINIFLVPETSQLSAVEVTGVRAGDKPLQTSSKISGTELELTRGQSLGEALKTIPGLNSIQTGPSISKPVIHGLHSNRVLIYNAGVRQEGQQWGSEHAPEIDPFIANQITVIKGAASVMYGSDAIGGVILVEPSPLRHEKGLLAQINTVAMSNNGQGVLSAMLESSTGKNQALSWRAQGTYKVAGNSKTADYYMNNTGFNEYNGAFMLGYRKGDFSSDFYLSSFNARIGIFSGSHIGSTTDLSNAISRKEPFEYDQSTLSYQIGRPYQSIRHHILKLRSAYMINGLGNLNAQYSYQQNNRQEYDVVRQAYEDNYQLKFDLSTQTADVYLDHNPISGIRGRVGLNGMFQHNFYDGRYLIPFFNSYSGGAYLIERWTKKKVSVEGGIRYDYKWMKARLRENVYDNSSPEIRPQFNFSQVSGTLGASYNLTEDYRLSTTIAKAWRPPAINELFSNGVHHGSASFEKGDRNLREESSFNLTAGISKTAGRLTGESSVYLNHINNHIYLKPDMVPVLTVRGAFPAFQYVQVNARFTGADLLSSYQFNKTFNARLKYSFVRAYDINSGKHLEFIPSDKLSLTAGFRLPDLKIWKNSSIDLTGSHTARQWRVNEEQDYAPTPGAYTLFNIDLSTHIPVSGNQASISLSCWNIFNTAYRDYLNRFRYYTDDTGRNFIIRLQVPLGIKQKTNHTNN
jgi:iron complex outermembrane receptor protein